MMAVFRVCMFVCAGASHSLDAVNRLNGDAAPIWVQGHLEDAETVGAGTISFIKDLYPAVAVFCLSTRKCY
jgi:hypothetical protein